MPKKLHERLEREADKKGLRGERRNAYIYGTLAKVEKKEHSSRKKSKKG